MTLENIKAKLNANKIKLNSLRSNDSKNFSPKSNKSIKSSNDSIKYSNEKIKEPKLNFSPKHYSGEIEANLKVPLVTKKKSAANLEIKEINLDNN